MKLRRIHLAILAGLAAMAFTGSLSAQNGYWQRFDGAYDSRGPESSARVIGREDGLLDGEHDRRDGKSYRPTHDGNYRHADRGYTAQYGDKEQYRLAYREAYERGYDQGYGRSYYR